VWVPMHTPPTVSNPLVLWVTPDERSTAVAAALAGPDADDLVDREHEDLPVTDPAGLGRFLDGFHHLHHLLLPNDDLELHLRKKIDDVLGPAVQLRVTLLPSEPFHLADGEALDADRRQALLHLVQLEGFDDRLDFFHVRASQSPRQNAAPPLTRRALRLYTHSLPLIVPPPRPSPAL